MGFSLKIGQKFEGTKKPSNETITGLLLFLLKTLGVQSEHKVLGKPNHHYD